QVAGCTRFNGIEHVLVIVEHRHDEHVAAARLPHRLADDLHSVDVGQAEVQEHDIGRSCLEHGKGGAAAAGTAGEHEVRIGQDGIGEPAQEFRFVFDDEHAGWHL